MLLRRLTLADISTGTFPVNNGNGENEGFEKLLQSMMSQFIWTRRDLL